VTEAAPAQVSAVSGAPVDAIIKELVDDSDHLLDAKIAEGVGGLLLWGHGDVLRGNDQSEALSHDGENAGEHQHTGERSHSNSVKTDRGLAQAFGQAPSKRRALEHRGILAVVGRVHA